MVSSCSALNCTSRKYKGTRKTFHRFPLKDKKLLKQWKAAAGRKNFKPTSSSLLCSDHFEKSCFMPFKNSCRLKESALPTLFSFKKKADPDMDPECRDQLYQNCLGVGTHPTGEDEGGNFPAKYSSYPKKSQVSKKSKCIKGKRQKNALCSVVSCVSRDGGCIKKYHRFPLGNKKLLKKWTDALGRKNWTPDSSSLICRDHFEQDCLVPFGNSFELKDDAVPTKFVHRNYMMNTTAEIQDGDELYKDCLEKSSIAEVSSKEIVQSKGSNYPDDFSVERLNQSDTEVYDELHSAQLSDNNSSSKFPAVEMNLTSDDEENFLLGLEVEEGLPYISPSLNEPRVLVYASNQTKGVSHDHLYSSTPRESKMKEITNDLRADNQKLKLQLQRLTQKYENAKSALEKSQKRVKSLEEDLKISTQNRFDLSDESFSPVMQQLIKYQVDSTYINASTLPYDEAIQNFSLKLHYYSPKAYEFVRTHLRIPHPKTLTRWTRNSKCPPGPIPQSFDYIETKAKDCTTKLLINLAFDEIPIKTAIHYDANADEYIGGIDLGNGPLENESEELASEALFFMAVCINGSWKIPLGYVLTNNLVADEKAILITEFTRMIFSTGAICTSITCVPHKVNLMTLRVLGLNISDLSSSYRNYYTVEGYKGSKVYCFLDICHMIKLMRNLFAESTVLHNGMDEDAEKIISWDYLVKLNDLQENQRLELAKRLGPQHTNFSNQAKKVSLAVQLLSSSVASALETCKKLPGFEDCQETANFIRLMDGLFDIMNSQSPLHKGLKSPLTAANFEDIILFLLDAEAYLQNLTTPNGLKLITTNRKTCLLGFILDIRSFISLAEEYLISSEPCLKCILGYKFSLDHLEHYFSLIRTKLGCEANTNPTALELRNIVTKALTARSCPLESSSLFTYC